VSTLPRDVIDDAKRICQQISDQQKVLFAFVILVPCMHLHVSVRTWYPYLISLQRMSHSYCCRLSVEMNFCENTQQWSNCFLKIFSACFFSFFMVLWFYGSLWTDLINEWMNSILSPWSLGANVTVENLEILWAESLLSPAWSWEHCMLPQALNVFLHSAHYWLLKLFYWSLSILAS